MVLLYVFNEEDCEYKMVCGVGVVNFEWGVECCCRDGFGFIYDVCFYLNVNVKEVCIVDGFKFIFVVVFCFLFGISNFGVVCCFVFMIFFVGCVWWC